MGGGDGNQLAAVYKKTSGYIQLFTVCHIDQQNNFVLMTKLGSNCDRLQCIPSYPNSHYFIQTSTHKSCVIFHEFHRKCVVVLLILVFGLILVIETIHLSKQPPDQRGSDN